MFDEVIGLKSLAAIAVCSIVSCNGIQTTVPQAQRMEAVLSYSTYLGGSTDSVAYGIAVDGMGNAYTTGYTRSFDFPVTEEAFQMKNARFVDAFFVRVGLTGIPSYATYIGGNGFDNGRDITIDRRGNIYITGFTNSDDFPTHDAFQKGYGGMRDAFVIKFDPLGHVVFSTYLGGSGDDVGNAIAVDGEENIYVMGRTTSSDFPVKNPFQKANGGEWDVFVTKMSADGKGILFSTYAGGKGWDEGRGITTDRSGNVFITGHSASEDFRTRNPFQRAYGGDTDAFIMRIGVDGALSYSTYLGGKGFDSGNGIVVDKMGNVSITGTTSSSDFPARNDLHRIKRGESHIFIARLNGEGNALLFSLLLGGGPFDSGRSLALDGAGNLYVTGTIASKDLPMIHPVQRTYGGGTDAFITKIDPEGTEILFSTFLGGSSYDSGSGITVGDEGDIFVAGTTESKDFPVKNPFQKAYSDYPYVFVTRIKQDKSNL